LSFVLLVTQLFPSTEVWTSESESDLSGDWKKVVGKILQESEETKGITATFDAPFDLVWKSILEAMVRNGIIITLCDKAEGKLTVERDFSKLYYEKGWNYVLGQKAPTNYVSSAASDLLVETVSPQQTKVSIVSKIIGDIETRVWQGSEFQTVMMPSSGRLEKEYLEFITAQMRLAPASE